LKATRKAESTDTAENRFIKNALEEFLFFCENCELKFEKYSTAKFESGLLATKLSTLLNQSFFQADIKTYLSKTEQSSASKKKWISRSFKCLAKI
jgi:predicted component of viral defense system (DUF524 family)